VSRGLKDLPDQNLRELEGILVTFKQLEGNEEAKVQDFGLEESREIIRHSTRA
jgi:inorganic pyrophosphatase